MVDCVGFGAACINGRSFEVSDGYNTLTTTITAITMDNNDELHDGAAESDQRMDYQHTQNQSISKNTHPQNVSSFVQEGDESRWMDPRKEPLKLTFELTESVLNWIQMTWIQPSLERNDNFVRNIGVTGHDFFDKLRVVRIPFLILSIGTWQKQSKSEGDLVAKCYFGRRKLAWEILEGSLKRKLQISWSDIIGLQIITGDPTHSGCDILNLELSKPPSFAQEIDPKPRKHPVWEVSDDFTESQATIHRRHQLQFPPGILDKLYKKLFITDVRLLKLSKAYFPTSKSPYFDIIRNNNIALPHHNSAVLPMLQNVPISSNGTFTPAVHQLPPTNNFSTTLPCNLNHSITTTRGLLCSFPVSNMETSGSDTVKKDGVNIVEHHGIQQHSDGVSIIVDGEHHGIQQHSDTVNIIIDGVNIVEQQGIPQHDDINGSMANVGMNGPIINIVEQNCSSDIQPLPEEISGAHTFQTRMEISGYDASQDFNRMMSDCLQGSIAAISSSSQDDERINPKYDSSASSTYDYEVPYLTLLSSPDQQQINAATEVHIQASDEEYLIEDDPLYGLWMPTENYGP